MNRSPISLVIIAIAALWLTSTIYIVQETEKAVVLQFGKLIKAENEAGIHFKLPWPVQNVRKFDARVLTLDAPTESFLTVQQKRLDVDSFVKWRVVDPEIYYRRTGGDEQTTESRLASRVNDGLRNEFGVRTLHEVVSGERDQLMAKLTKDLNERSSEELGIEIIDVRVKRIDLPETISETVYSRMRADRVKLATEYRSEGREAAEEIRATADKEKVVIESDAYRMSEKIRGEGDAQAASIYASAYQKDPEFYAFVRSLNAYKESFANKGDVIVVEPDSDFFRYLKDRNGK